MIRRTKGAQEILLYCPGYINHPIVGYQQAKVPWCPCHMMELICGQAPVSSDTGLSAGLSLKKTWLNVSQRMGSLSLSVRKIAFPWRTHAVRWPDWHGTPRKIGYRCDYARLCKLELTELLVQEGVDSVVNNIPILRPIAPSYLNRTSRSG